MTPRIGLILLTALLMQCGNPVETPLPGAETIPARLQETTHFNGGNAMFHAARMTEMGDRGSGTPGYRQQLDYLKKELAKHGWTCQEQSFEQETSKGPIQFVNLRARFGKAPDFQAPVRGLLTCHIDTKQGIAGFTGTNDGASGAAAILETARILAGEPARAGKLELVFFDGEESFAEHMDSDDGLYGSKHYAAAMRKPLPKWMINLDMVGRQGKNIFNTVANSLLGQLGGDMGSLYIAAFGVINGYILYITMMVAQCFSYGLQPIAAFNVGAKAWARLKETLSCTLKYQVVTLAAVSAVLWVAATPVCAFFAGSDPALVEVAANATRIVILAVALGYLAMTMSMYFQAVEKVGIATFTGLLRYVICSVPLMYLLGNMMGVQGVWFALVAADAITGLISIALAVRESKRLATL